MTVTDERAERAERDATLRRTGRAVLALAVSELVGKVATFVLFLSLARILGVEEFGVLSFGFGLGLLLNVFTSLGLDARLVQLGSVHPERLDHCYGALVAIRLVLASVVALATTVILFLTIDGVDAVVVALLVISCQLEPFIDVSRAVCGARQRQEFPALVLVLQRLATLVLSVGLLLVTRDAVWAAVGYLLATTVGVACMHLATRRIGVRMRFRGSRPEVRLMLQAVPVMGLGAIATSGMFRLDAALIGVMLGTTAVGVYSTGYRIFETSLFVSWTLSRALVPVIASRPHDTEHVRSWTQRAMVVMVALYAPYCVVLALRGDDLVELLFGAEFRHGGLMLALAATPLLFGISHLCSSVLLAIRPDPVVLVSSVLGLVVNLALNLALITTVGITGAAWATTVAFGLEGVVLMIVLQRRVGRPWAARSLLGVASGCAAVIVVCLAVSPVGLAVVAAVCAYLAIVGLVTRIADPALVDELSSLRPSVAAR